MGKPPWLRWKGQRKQDPRTVGMRHGFRSGLEERNAKHLQTNGIAVAFEAVKLEYVIPATKHTYTPDFELPNGILVETKGRFLAQDRAKHLYVKLQHPEREIRLVFQNPNARLNPKKPGSTTYAEWAERHGIKWAKALIPIEWAREPGPACGAHGPGTIKVSAETADYFVSAARLPQQPQRGAPRGRAAVARKKAGVA